MRVDDSTSELPATMADARVIAAELRGVAEVLGASDEDSAGLA